jgi:hypothetical protein
MTEELFGVGLNRTQNYNGRSYHGVIKPAMLGQGVFMTKECAEKLVGILKFEYPEAHVVQLSRGDRDAAAATSLEELGENVGMSKLTAAVHQCVIEGFGKQEIVSKVADLLNISDLTSLQVNQALDSSAYAVFPPRKSQD